jgi:hypothetical protein
VQHLDFDAAKPPRDNRLELQRSRIDIASHRLDRCDGTELVEHRPRPHVTGMEDLVNAV